MTNKNKNNSANKRVEMITNNPKRAIRTMSWPVMIVMLIMIGYSIIDSIWVAGLGISALAALGFITPIYSIIIGIGQGIGSGTTSILARSIGEKDKSKASNAGIHSLIITIIVSIIITILLLLFLKDILVLMGASNLLDLAMRYGITIFSGSFIFLLGVVGSSILRAEGDMKRGTYILAISSIINMILDPIFIYTLNMGITGAAVATLLSSSISAIVIFYWILIKGDTYIKLKLKEFKFKLAIVKDILIVSLPVSLEEVMMSASAIGINAILAYTASATAVAVYTAGWRIITLGVIPALGIETATLTVAGIAYGAKNYKNLEISSNYGIKLGVAMGAVLTVFVFIFAPAIVSLFTYTSNTANLTNSLIEFLRITAICFIAVPFGLVSTAIFQGAGKGLTTLILNATRDVILIIVFAYLLGLLFNFGEMGVYFGITIGLITGSIINYLYFKVFLRRLKRNSENDGEINSEAIN